MPNIPEVAEERHEEGSVDLPKVLAFTLALELTVTTPAINAAR